MGQRYTIHGHIARAGAQTFTVKVHVVPVDRAGPSLDESSTCQPCDYAQARTTCYSMVAKVAHAIGKRGDEVADVVITDDSIKR
jgi:hypothetical protein